jgi:hypothetical protein
MERFSLRLLHSMTEDNLNRRHRHSYRAICKRKDKPPFMFFLPTAPFPRGNVPRLITLILYARYLGKTNLLIFIDTSTTCMRSVFVNRVASNPMTKPLWWSA